MFVNLGPRNKPSSSQKPSSYISNTSSSTSERAVPSNQLGVSDTPNKPGKIRDNNSVLECKGRGEWIVQTGKWTPDRAATQEFQDLLDLLNEQDNEIPEIFGQSVNEFFGASDDLGKNWFREYGNDKEHRRGLSRLTRGRSGTANEHTRSSFSSRSHSNTSKNLILLDKTPFSSRSRYDLSTEILRSDSRDFIQLKEDARSRHRAFTTESAPVTREDEASLQADTDNQALYYDLLMKQADAKAGKLNWKPSPTERAFMAAKKAGKPFKWPGEKMAASVTVVSVPTQQLSIYTSAAGKERYYELMMQRAEAVAKGEKWQPPTADDKELILANSMGDVKYAKYKARKRGRTASAADLSDDDWVMVDLDEEEIPKAKEVKKYRRGISGWLSSFLN